MSTAFRNFIITFVLALIAFGLLGSFFIKDYYPKLTEGTESASTIIPTDWPDYWTTQSTSSGNQTDESAATLAFFCLDYENRLCATSVVRVNEKTKAYTHITIPHSTKITVNGSLTTLRNYYAMLDSKGNGALHNDFLDIYKYITGFTIDKYFVLSMKTLCSLTDYVNLRFGTISYTLKEGIAHKNPLYDQFILTNPTAGEDAIQKYAVYTQGELIGKVGSSFLENFDLSKNTNPSVPTVPVENEDAVLNMFSDIYSIVFTKIIGNSAIGGSTSEVATLAGYFASTNVTEAERETYAPLLFAYSYYEHKTDITYPLKGTGEADWSTAIKLFRTYDKAE